MLPYLIEIYSVDGDNESRILKARISDETLLYLETISTRFRIRCASEIDPMTIADCALSPGQMELQDQLGLPGSFDVVGTPQEEAYIKKARDDIRDYIGNHGSQSWCRALRFGSVMSKYMWDYYISSWSKLRR